MFKRDVKKMQKLRLRKKGKLSKQTQRTSRWIYTVCQNFYRSVELKRLIESSQLPSGTGCLYM